VNPRDAGRALGLGISRTYALMRSGELRSYRDGRGRRVLVSSIDEYVARRLADADRTGWRPYNPQERGQSPKKKRKKSSTDDCRPT
jgi:excisionase family DNA binding protein